MTFDVSVFRTQFPEFADTGTYPDAQINLWASLAQVQVVECVWKGAWLMGVSLYTAHEISLARQNAQISTNGGMPGTTGGVPSTKTVGGASVGYDAESNSEKNAGYWNLTNYGKQFIRLARLFGAAAIQL